jgi:hypothetical protein
MTFKHRRLTKKQAKNLARQFKYRAPAYYDHAYDQVRSAASITDFGDYLNIHANGYCADMRELLKWAKANVPGVHTFVYKELGHMRRVVHGVIPC